MEDESLSLIRQLKGLIQTLDELNTLLKNDQVLFSQNKIAEVQLADDKKQKCLERITQALADIKKTLPNAKENLIQSLREHIQKYHVAHQSTVNDLIQLLQTKLSDGYENLIANNHVVIMNLTYLKTLWDKLLTLSPEHNTVYEKPLAQPK